MIRVGIVGASGYTGGQLLGLCLAHPEMAVVYLGSRSLDGVALSSVLQQFSGEDLCFSLFEPDNLPELDVLFLALPHGVSHQFMPLIVAQGCRVIDLSADFRLSEPGLFDRIYESVHESPELISSFSYGLTDVNYHEIATRQHCANPGCFATAMSLALAPLRDLNVGQVIVDGKTGISGAGKQLKEPYLFCEANETVTGYKAHAHRHVHEVRQSTGFDVHFVPHLAPMTAGILCTHYIELLDTTQDVVAAYQTYYEDRSFVHVGIGTYPTTKAVTGTNQAHIGVHVFEDTPWITVFSAIDNLGKGAATQAVHNFNVMMGLDEAIGL